MSRSKLCNLIANIICFPIGLPILIIYFIGSAGEIAKELAEKLLEKTDKLFYIILKKLKKVFKIYE